MVSAPRSRCSIGPHREHVGWEWPSAINLASRMQLATQRYGSVAGKAGSGPQKQDGDGVPRLRRGPRMDHEWAFDFSTGMAHGRQTGGVPLLFIEMTLSCHLGLITQRPGSAGVQEAWMDGWMDGGRDRKKQAGGVRGATHTTCTTLVDGWIDGNNKKDRWFRPACSVGWSRN